MNNTKRTSSQLCQLISMEKWDFFNSTLYCQHSSNVSLDLWGTESPCREFLYSNDLADAGVFLMNDYDVKDIGEFVDIGAGKNLIIKILAGLIKNIVGLNRKIEWDDSKPDGTPQKLLNVDKLYTQGLEEEISLFIGNKKVYKKYNS